MAGGVYWNYWIGAGKEDAIKTRTPRQMEQSTDRVVLKISLGSAAASVFVIVGYLLAVLSFRQEVLVDCRSGARKTTCTLFPFSISEDGSHDAFRELFGYSPGEDARWISVASRHLFDWLDQEAITEGTALIRAEGELVWLLTHDPLVSSEAHKMSKEFYDTLHDRGVYAAAEYTDKLRLERLMHMHHIKNHE